MLRVDVWTKGRRAKVVKQTVETAQTLVAKIDGDPSMHPMAKFGALCTAVAHIPHALNSIRNSSLVEISTNSFKATYDPPFSFSFSRFITITGPKPLAKESLK